MSRSGSGRRHAKRSYFRGYGPARVLVVVGALSLAGCFEQPEDRGPASREPAAKPLDTASAEDCVEASYLEHRYLFCRERLSWEDAREACAAMGYHLVSIADAEEEAWIYDQLEDLPRMERSPQKPVKTVGNGNPAGRSDETGPRNSWWMGYNDRDEEGTWAWEDGSEVSYVNWYGRKGLAIPKGKDCAQLNRYAPDFGWYATPCGPKARFVCEEGDGAPPRLEAFYLDADGDGWGDASTRVVAAEAPEGHVDNAEDCDDSSVAVFPGADELCNGIDDDCDGEADEDAIDQGTWYADSDGDGHGDASATVTACSCPSGFVASHDDCDDANAATFPGADETCNGIDDDCDGETDEAAIDAPTWYADADLDGHGDPALSASACSCPTGFVASATDCDDRSAATFPGADELCNAVDDDCDGSVDEQAIDAPTWYADADADGHGDAASTVTACTCPGGFVASDDDCDDNDASASPTALEFCDGIDNDCDGVSDEDNAVDSSRWYRDEDGDGWGDPDMSALSCFEIPRYVHNDEDCDDHDAGSSPSAPELCDGIDNDCDGRVDDDPVDSLIWYADGDGDGFGAEPAVASCEQPSGHVLDGGDCDDSDAAIHPVAAEHCDGVDEDCDGLVDNDTVDGATWYRDLDFDGYGGDFGTTTACSAPSGYADNQDDCDDMAPGVHPGAEELCDGTDNDCDGRVDDDAADAPTWYADRDGDGYGNPSSTRASCEQPSGYVADASDCADSDAATHPGAEELCDDADNDCDGTADEDPVDAPLWYADRDGDGYGAPSDSLAACTQPCGYASASLAIDCDDGDGATFPGADETCDGQDEDCDGLVDEDPSEGPSWYADADGDGHGDPGLVTVACTAPSGWVAAADDCDDNDASSWIGPRWYRDADGDGHGDPSQSVSACAAPAGHVAQGDDCDDSAASTFPGADETCNATDDDCDGLVDEEATDAPSWYADSDGDGYGDATSHQAACAAPAAFVADSSDCDDSAANVHPGAEERCDDVDEDCDGSVDEDAIDAATWYRDLDADGWGDETASTSACAAPSGYVAADRAGDCDDNDAGVHPSADELCNGADEDCDGLVDEDDARDATAWYVDSDGDGYGNPSAEQLSCDPIPGSVANAGDCDDGDDAVNPEAQERCDGADNDCDGALDEDDAIDPSTWYRDADGDGWGLLDDVAEACMPPRGYAALQGDCDDQDSDAHPSADELCDGADNDCDGDVDEDAIDATAWYADSDGDGWGSGEARGACAPLPGEVDQAGDCDDATASIHPLAQERCDGLDNDCDGAVDDGAEDALTWYTDSDGDGWGLASRTQQACSQPAGTSATAGDCQDRDASVHPGAAERCDGQDNDCDGVVDSDAIDMVTWYRDADGDGFGTVGDTVISCEGPSGYVARSGDCDDGTPGGAPGPEYCDGFDNDCDGVVDEPEALDASWWYRDRDGDGHGDLETPALACYQPFEFVLEGDDCDDWDGTRYPGATELCDGQDNDCDAQVDEDAVGQTTWYADLDLDGYGDPASASTACEAPEGWVTDSADCDDSDATQHPGAQERCNGADDDCDGTVDEDAADGTWWYADADADGYGDASLGVEACTAPEGSTEDASDCDDSDASAHPGARELCDGVDNDCDGSTDEDDAVDAASWYADADADGWGDEATSATSCTQPAGWIAQGGDCDDTDGAISPSAVETCNGRDDDCDGSSDEDAIDGASWYRDLDGDGYGGESTTRSACEAPDGWVSDASDCDDQNDAVHPAAEEWCDDLDNDCDGLVDDEALDGQLWYADADGDLWGLTDDSLFSCAQPEGYVSRSGDCNDASNDARPDAREVCDGIDNDCDGDSDEDDAYDARRWYLDEDGDGYGQTDRSWTACAAPAGYASSRADCDDTDPLVHPTAEERCNGIDDDCDGTVDLDSADIVTQYPDADGDGYGAKTTALQACDLLPGYVTDRSDCDDGAASVNPGADERCNGVDDDCDTVVDEDSAVDRLTWYADDDGDGYGDPLDTAYSCSQPEGYLADSLDCDDDDPATNPDGEDTCKDGKDNDCDGVVDDCSGWPSEGALAAAEIVLLGERSSTYAGNALAALGDSDGDGRPELAVAAWQDDAAGRNAGAVYLVERPALGEQSLATAQATLLGEVVSDLAGSALASAGDVNGDGYPDLLVGAPGQDSAADAAGAAYLVLGPIAGQRSLADADARILGAAEDDKAGSAVASAGDVNGDGRADLLIGAPYESSGGSSAGAAYLLLGPVDDTSLASASARMLGAAIKDYAGSAVAGLGDVDGDGFGDIAVGAPGHDAVPGAGAVHILSGPMGGDIDLSLADIGLYGSSSGDSFGAVLAPAGDLDGDGYGDLLVGAEGADEGGDSAGAAYLFYGPMVDGTGADSADLVLVGAAKYERAGAAVAVAGDLDADGWDDLVVGAPGHVASGAKGTGAAYLVFAPSEGVLDLGTDALRFVGEAGADNAGLSVAGPGDMDGDGIDDLAVGAEGNDGNGDRSGAAYLILGL